MQNLMLWNVYCYPLSYLSSYGAGLNDEKTVMGLHDASIKQDALLSSPKTTYDYVLAKEGMVAARMKIAFAVIQFLVTI